MSRIVVLFFIYYFTANALFSFGQNTGSPGGPPHMQTLTVREVRESGVVIGAGDGPGREIKPDARTRFVRMAVSRLLDIKLNDPVVVMGRRDAGSSLSALTIIIESKEAQVPSMPGNAAGPVAGRVVQTSPLKVKTSSGETVTIAVDQRTRIMKEADVSISDFSVGDSVMVQPGKIILLDGKAGGPVQSPPASGGSNAPLSGRWSEGLTLCTDGPASVKGRLPSAPDPRENKYDKKLMASKYSSAFGFKDPNMLRPDLMSWYFDFAKTMNDIGAYWMEAPAIWTFRWSLMQGVNPDGSLTDLYWKRTDGMIKYAQAYNIHMCGKILTQEPSGELFRKAPNLPKNMTAFRKFVRAVVERYDGDGIDDMPGLGYPVKLWKIEDEVMDPKYWGGSAHDYAVLLKAVYEEAKKADPDCVIIASMIRGYDGLEKDPVTFTRAFYEALAGITDTPPYDAVDQHLMPTDSKVPVKDQYRRIRQMINEVHSTAKKYGFPEMPIYAHEVAGDVVTEKAQAIDMVKRHVYPLGCGVRQIFWSGLKEAELKGGGAYAEDPANSKFRENTFIKDNDARKLAYYSYKKMTEVLDGFDHIHTRILIEKNDIYVIRFVKDKLPVWVAWYDGNDTRRIKIDIPSEIKSVTITGSMPKYASGADVSDYNTAFEAVSEKINDGSLELTLDTIPVYVEASVIIKD